MDVDSEASCHTKGDPIVEQEEQKIQPIPIYLMAQIRWHANKEP